MICVSLIIPVRNEAETIGALLDDVRAQTRAPRQILVVDTGSRDRTVAIVEAAARGDSRVRLLSAPGGLPGGARNVGLRHADSDWVAFVDGGMRVDATWLARLMAPVDRGAAVDVVLGGLEPVADTRAARAAALAFLPAYRPAPGGGRWRGFCLPSSAVRTSVALAVGGFPESLRSGEDLIFYRRLQAAARIAYAPDAVVRWRHAASPSAVWRRFRTYAEHSFRARLMDDWFAVMRRRYLALALATGPALPAAATALLLARAVVMQRRKAELADTTIAGRVRQIFEVAFYLGAIDAATWTAWWSWSRQGRPLVDDAVPIATSPSKLDSLASHG